MTAPVSLCTNTVIGTPQARWRDTTQSGRVSIMPRDAVLALRRHPARVADGLRARAARSVSATRSMVLSMAMNHCGVARKITGFFERQECG